MIGIDWGTTSFRAFRIARDGTIRERRAGPKGIVNVPDGRFGDTLREEIGPWLAAGENHVLLSGMIGSRPGWEEAPYLPCGARKPKCWGFRFCCATAASPACRGRIRNGFGSRTAGLSVSPPT